jgi:hypothetical protein
VEAIEPGFTAVDAGKGVAKRYLPGTERLYLGPLEHNTGLVGVEHLKFVASLTVPSHDFTPVLFAQIASLT